MRTILYDQYGRTVKLPVGFTAPPEREKQPEKNPEHHAAPAPPAPDKGGA